MPPGATGSSTTNSIEVSFGAEAKSGNISVKASNSCGNSAAVSKAITVNNPPEQPDAIVGESEVCAGESSVIYSVSHIENADTYIWLLPPGATGSSTTNSIEVSFGDEAKPGEITVTPVNSCGSGGFAALPVTVNIIPATPAISLIDNTLHSDAPFGNQWYYEGELITDVEEQEFIPAKSGEYYVKVALSGCSSQPSNSIYAVLTDVNVSDLPKEINIYPNPVETELTLEAKSNSEKLIFEIVNMLGQTVYKGVLIEQITIDTAHLLPGHYFVRFSNSTTSVKKFVKF